MLNERLSVSVILTLFMRLEYIWCQNNAYDDSVKVILSWFKNVVIKIGVSWEK